MLPARRVCRLSAEERRRNEPGDMLVLEHTAGWHEQEHCNSTLPQHFASIHHAHRWGANAWLGKAKGGCCCEL